MERIQERARLWLAANGFEGKVIAQRLYEDRYVVVLDSGPKIDIPLEALPELYDDRYVVVPPAIEPPPAPKRKRRRSKKNG